MRYGADHNQQSRAKILAASGRAFRRHGFDGVGVDGLAEEAGVTSGAFYKHFPSKSAAFRDAVVAGLDELRQAVEDLRASEGEAWLDRFVEFYLSVKRTCEAGESCALQAFGPEVSRAPPETRIAWDQGVGRVVDAVAAGLSPGPDPRGTAWSILALLTGGVTLARAAPTEALGLQIAEATRAAITAITTA